MISASVTAIVVSPIIEKVWTYPSRATEVFSYAKNWEDESHMRGGSCFLFESHDYEFRYQKECLDVSPGSLNVLIVGDSYAAHLWSGLQTSYPSINFLQATAAACIPIIGGKSN